MAIASIATLKSYFQTGDFPTQTQFEDLIDTLAASGDNQLYSTTVSLTAAQIKTGNTSPILAISSPGSGKAIQIINASCSLTTGNFSSTDFDLIVDTGTQPQFSTTDNNGLRIIDLSNPIPQFAQLCQRIDGIGVIAMVSGKTILIQTNANSAIGTGTAKVYILYRIITI